MAIRGIAVGATTEYISDLDPAKATEGQEGATRFTLGALTSTQGGAAMDRAQIVQGDRVFIGQNGLDYEIVRMGLRGWSNFTDSNDQPIPFETEKAMVAGVVCEVVTFDAMNRLSLSLRGELALQVVKLSPASFGV